MRLRHTQFAWGRFLIWGHLPYLEHLEHLCGFYRSFSFKCQCPRRLTILTMLDLWGARVAGARCNCTHSRRARVARAIADGSREPEYAPCTCRALLSPLRLPMQVPCKSHQAGATSLRRAIADGSREPEYAPPTNRPLHLPRAPHTVAFAKACAILQVTDTNLMREKCGRVRVEHSATDSAR
jgi:hypothetical protein